MKIKKIIYFALISLGLNLFNTAEMIKAKTFNISIDNDKKTAFNTYEVNGYDYIDLQALASCFFVDAKADKNKFIVSSKEFALVFAPSSFYICYKDGKIGKSDELWDTESVSNENLSLMIEEMGFKIFQMRKPSIYMNKRLLIPLNSFLISLEVLGLYKVDGENNQLKLKRFKATFENIVTNADIMNADKIFNLKQTESGKRTIEYSENDSLKLDLESDQILNGGSESENNEKSLEKIITNPELLSEIVNYDNLSNHESKNSHNYQDVVVHLGSENKKTEDEKSTTDNMINRDAQLISENISDDILNESGENEKIKDLNLEKIENEKAVKNSEELEEIISNDNAKFSIIEPGKPKTIDNETVINEDYTPNVYVVPPNLNRDGLGIVNNSKEPEQYADNNKNKITAAKIKEPEFKTEFVKIYAEQKAEFTELHIYSNSIIEEYQKPDCDGKLMTIRLPNGEDKITDYSMTKDVYPIESIKPDKIRQFLIYKVQTNENIRNCTTRRNGPKELIFTIYPENPKINELKPNENVPKTDEIKEPEQKVQTYTPSNIENIKKKWNLDVIVLDPGHGGHDAGAIGVTGVKEKDITLKLCLHVKELLSKEMPETKVVLTRSDDRFIELYKRGQIANQSNGKLFISIHLNSANKKPSPATGFETYILRPGRNDDAIRVANFENSVIKLEKQQDKYKTLNDEELIIATMAQSAFVKFSELLARNVQQEVVRETKHEDRGVKQAGFYVLIGASMPNILFESGFLSNREEEQFVSTSEGQEKIAKGMVNAIKKYAEEYAKY